MDRKERIRTKTASIWQDAKYAGVGIEFGISVAACYFVGDWAQDRWNFAPWGALAGVLLGFASGLRRLIKIAEVESKRKPMTQDKQRGSHDSESDSESDG
jgi:hypothetical protein